MKHEGITIKLGGDEYVVPPLSLGQVKRLFPMIEMMQKPDTNLVERFSAVISVAHAALSRNYPEMKIEEVEDLIDLGNIKIMTDAIMAASGFMQRGEAPTGSVPTGT